jgi:hypothetical protein
MEGVAAGQSVSPDQKKLSAVRKIKRGGQNVDRLTQEIIPFLFKIKRRSLALNCGELLGVILFMLI